MKTYGKYTDCSGVEQNITEGHMHELIDRLHLMEDMFNNYIVDHPASEIALIRHNAKVVAGLIGDLYQQVNRIEFDRKNQNVD